MYHEFNTLLVEHLKQLQILFHYFFFVLLLDHNSKVMSDLNNVAFH